MTSAASFREGAGSAPRLPLALRLALRDLRGGLSGFYIFLLCIALGAGAIGAINGLSASLSDAIVRDGKILLGGDAEASLIHRQANEAERSYLASQGAVSEIATLRAMARKPDGSAQALIDLKAVDSAYPLYGAVNLENGMSFAKLIKDGAGAAVDRALIDQLNIRVGDSIAIGQATFPVLAIVDREPDRLAAGPTFGARVMLSSAALMRTGLIEPGSLVRWSYRIRYADPAKAALLKTAVAEKLPEAGFQVRDSRDPTPGISSTITRLTGFLTLTGLAAMLTGGIGVGNAVAAFIERKRKTIAAYKALGADEKTVFSVFFVEISILTGAGILLGLSIAAILPFIAAEALKGLVPIEIDPGLHGKALGLAALFGALTALPFILWPLGRAQQIRAAELFRIGGEETLGFPPKFYRLSAIGAVMCLFAVAILLSPDAKIAAWTCGALLFAFALFWAIGSAFRTLARKSPKTSRAEIALALANIGGPGSLARTIALSLGTGLTLLTAVSLVDASLTEELKTHLPDNAPSHFLLDIPKQDLQPLQELIGKEAPLATLTTAPMLRGRFISLHGVPAEQIKAPANVEWVLNGDRGLTYAESLPAESMVTEGAWWPEKYEGEPLVSFENDIAKGLGLKIGDQVVVNVLGRNLTAKVANFRTVKWNSAGINFVMIFSPNALRQAPFKFMATLNWPRGIEPDTAVEQNIVKAVTARFPAISAIRVRDALNAFSGVFEKIMGAVRIAGSVTLIMGVLVIAGALIAAQRRRIYETAILRTLGASKGRILAAHLIEYLALSLSLSVIAGGLGLLAAYLIVTLSMDLSFSPSLLALLQPSLIETIFIVALGTVGTLRVLSVKPARYLRSE